MLRRYWSFHAAVRSPRLHCAENILAGNDFVSILPAPRIRCVRKSGRGLSGFFVARILGSGGSYFNDDANN